MIKQIKLVLMSSLLIVSLSGFSNIGNETKDKKNLINSLYEKNKNEKAIEECENLIKMYPNMEFPYVMLTKIYYNKNELNKAIEEAKKVLKINPYNDFIYSFLGLIYFGKSDLDKSISNSLEALKINEKNELANGVLGNAYKEKKDIEKALFYYLKQIKLNNELGYKSDYLPTVSGIYYDKGDYNNALEYLDNFLNENPDIPNSRLEIYEQRLGDIYFRLNRYKEAIDIYEKLVNNKSKEPLIYYSLARAYLLDNNKEKAIINLKRSIELDKKYFQNAKDDKDLKILVDSEEFKNNK